MKKRMITLLLVLVLVVSLLPAGVLAGDVEGGADAAYKMKYQIIAYDNGYDKWPSWVAKAAYDTTFICTACEKDLNHAGYHQLQISKIKEEGIPAVFRATEKMGTERQIEELKNNVMFIGWAEYNNPNPTIRSFDELGTVDLPKKSDGWRTIYLIAERVYFSAPEWVDVECISDGSGHDVKTYALTKNSYSIGIAHKNADGNYTCELTIDKAPYIEKYNADYTDVHTNAVLEEETVTINVTRKNGTWTADEKAKITVKCMPDAPDEDFWSFNNAVDVSCTTTADHDKKNYGLLADTYEIGDVAKNADGVYTVTGTITDPAAYVGEFSKAHNKLHVEDTGSTYTFSAKWDKDLERWEMTSHAQIVARCEPDAPTVDTIEGLAAVKVDCIADDSHKDEIYGLVKDTYILGAPAFEDGKYVLTGKVNVPDGYVKAYADAHGEHELDKDNSPATFKLVWNAELGRWELTELAFIAVKCPSDGYNPVSPILAALNKTAPKLNTREHFAYVQGYPDGTVRPSGSVTRAETAAILFRLMDASSRSLYYSTAAGFRDVDSTKWYNTYVATLNNAGVITDSRDGYFRPDAAITRAELAAMLAQFAEQKSAAIYFSDVSSGYWAAKAIALTADLGWINGYPDGTFGPDKTVTRAELMAMINRATGRAPKSADALLTGMKTWKDNANTGVWYYLDVQEATNSHSYMVNPTEYWTGLEADPNWAQYE